MTRRLAFLLPVALAACASIDKPTPENLARGRAVRRSTPAVEPYYQEISQTEKRLLAASSDAERAQPRQRHLQHVLAP